MDSGSKKNKHKMGRGAIEGIGIGIVMGVVLGAAFDNVGLGVALGIAFGAALGPVFVKELKPDEESDGIND